MEKGVGMPHKDPQNYTMFDWFLVTLVALWASLTAFFAREAKPQAIGKRLYFLAQDIVVSGGTTYLVYMASTSYGIKDGIALFLAGFAGHKATRVSYLLELAVIQKAGIKEKGKKDG